MKSVEMTMKGNATTSHPARGAWIEMTLAGVNAIIMQSHPARGAWIEIKRRLLNLFAVSVAPRKGCVD